SNIPSSADGNNTMLVINRISGNLATGADLIGSIFGIIYNDAENAFSYSFNANSCQLKFSFTNNVPRTTPRFTNIVPAGRTAWTNLWPFAGAPLTGAAINFNPGASASSSAFNQGHNLHKLTFTTSSVSVPVFPPNC